MHPSQVNVLHVTVEGNYKEESDELVNALRCGIDKRPLPK